VEKRRNKRKINKEGKIKGWRTEACNMHKETETATKF